MPYFPRLYDISHPGCIYIALAGEVMIFSESDEFSASFESDKLGQVMTFFGTMCHFELENTILRIS